MRLAQRSAKAREKYADGLMTISNAIASALMISIFVAPLSAVIAQFNDQREVGALLQTLFAMPSMQFLEFVLCYAISIAVSMYFRFEALNIYDALGRQ